MNLRRGTDFGPVTIYVLYCPHCYFFMIILISFQTIYTGSLTAICKFKS